MNAADERALAEAATPGPWVGDEYMEDGLIYALHGHNGERIAVFVNVRKKGTSDLAFAEHFGPDRVLEMLALCDQSRQADTGKLWMEVAADREKELQAAREFVAAARKQSLTAEASKLLFEFDQIRGQS